MPVLRRSKEDAEETRQGILVAAEDLFALRGVAATSLGQIAVRAGVTRGAIYWHFKDKAALLEALHEKFMPPENELIEAALQSAESDVLAVFAESAKSFLALFARDVSRQRLFMILSNEVGEPRSAKAVERMEWSLRLGEHAKANGMLAEGISSLEAGLTIAALMNGLLGEWLRSGHAFDLAEVGGRMVDRAIAGLRP